MAQTRLLQAENIENKILTQGNLLVSQTENPLCRSLKIQARQNAALWQKDMTHLVCMCVCARMCVCMHTGQRTNLAIVPQELSPCLLRVSHCPGAGPAAQAGWAGNPRDLCVSASSAVSVQAGRNTPTPFKNMIQVWFWGWNLGPLALRTHTLSFSQTGLI